MKQYINYNQGPKSGTSIYYYVEQFIRKIEFLIFVIISVILITITKNNSSFQSKISSLVVEIALPINNIVVSPIKASFSFTNYIKSLVNAKKENEKLRQENELLKSFYVKSLTIKHENEELKDLMNFIQARSTKYHSVRLIGFSNTPYSNNIIVNAGKKDGIAENNIVIGKKSVIGRVIDVQSRKSRVLTIYDQNSRIPIITSKSRTRGVLAGHNSKIMTIEYLEKDHKISQGDVVFTSGDGEHLPPGLPVGIIKKVKGQKVTVEAIENPDQVNLAVISNY